MKEVINTHFQVLRIFYLYLSLFYALRASWEFRGLPEFSCSSSNESVCLRD